MCVKQLYYGSDGQTLLLLLQVVQDEVVVEQLLYAHPVVGVLPQALVQEVPRLLAHEHVGGYADLVLYYLDQFLLFVDLEGVLPHQHLVHHDAQRPDVYFFVVLPAL